MKRSNSCDLQELPLFIHLFVGERDSVYIDQQLSNALGELVRRFGAHAAPPAVPKRPAPGVLAPPDAALTCASSPAGLALLRCQWLCSTTQDRRQDSRSERAALARPHLARLG